MPKRIRLNIEVNDIEHYVFSYTGHEHLLKFKIININGRMYDPVLGRMLSPDNYVQDPNNPQNYNRYAYCLNNPLKYTDPSGEFFTSLFLGPVEVFIDAALWSGTINLVSNWNSIDNLGEGLAAFGAGAAQGALTAANPALGAIVGGAGGLVYGSVNQLGFEIYKRTGDRKYFDTGRNTGKSLQQGIEAGKQQISQDATSSGGGNAPYGMNENSITVTARSNGIHTVTVSIPYPIYRAVPTVSQYIYYSPSLYRSVNIYSLSRY